FLWQRISLPPVGFKSLAAQTAIKMRAREIGLQRRHKKFAKALQILPNRCKIAFRTRWGGHTSAQRASHSREDGRHGVARHGRDFSVRGISPRSTRRWPVAPRRTWDFRSN